MHLTLKKEATIPPEKDLTAQQERFDRFRKEYNHERPHEALDMKTPSEVYQASERKMPKKMRAYDYPLHVKVRRVSRNGGIRWKHLWVNVSQTLMEEYIGFEEIEDGVHNVYFYDILIGRFFEEINRIRDIIDRVPTRPTIVKQSYPCTWNKV